MKTINNTITFAVERKLSKVNCLFGENDVTLPLDVDRPSLHIQCSLHTAVYVLYTLYIGNIVLYHINY